jgi:hypothetical protein
MSHPTSRAERRHQRDRVIARRRKVAETEWGYNNGDWIARGWEPFVNWGVYAKWNGGCGSSMCHAAKYFKIAHKRREALHNSESQAEFRRRNKVAYH